MTNPQQELIERLQTSATDLLEDGLSAYAQDIDAAIAEIQRLEEEIDDVAREATNLAMELGATKLANESLTARVAELEDFCIWMTGAHDFTQYPYFVQQRDLLLNKINITPPEASE